MERRVVQSEKLEELADLVVALRRMTHGNGRVQRVPVPPPHALTTHVSLFDEIGDDSLRGPLGDADGGGDVTQTDLGITVDAEQDLAVARQEVPSAICFRT